MKAIPNHISVAFGSARKFRAHHRAWLRRAMRAIDKASMGAAYSPASDEVTKARQAICAAIEATAVKQWEGRK